jgi:hypothetical protein
MAWLGRKHNQALACTRRKFAAEGDTGRSVM